MSSLPTTRSIHDLPPLERGGVEARKGFEVQDHVAVGFLIDLLTTPGLLEVWCETHDDITLIWHDTTEQEVEFVQVKSLSLNQLWSVAKLTERERKEKQAVSGSSILERSLANDRCCESCRFRLVTTLPPKGDLDFLQLPFDAPDRIARASEIAKLADDVDGRIGTYRSSNGNGPGFWLNKTMWDVHQSIESLSSSNRLRLQRVVFKAGTTLFPDQLDELYASFLTMARDAAVSDWGNDPAKKKICKECLTKWLDTQLESRRHLPASAGTALRGKLEKAGVVDGDIRACLESRQRYLVERYSPQYLKLADLNYVEAEVAAVLHSLRAKLDSEELADNGIAFHAFCLKALEELQSKLPVSGVPLSILHGCMYNIADRCIHRFRRASA